MRINIKTNKKLQFSVMFVPESDGGFTAIVPSLPGCVSYGKNIIEARNMITDAIKGYIISMKKHGEFIPEDHGSFNTIIEVPVPTYA